MRTLLRFVSDYRALWRIWLPMLLLAALLPVVTFAMPLTLKRLIDEALTLKQAELLPQLALIYGGLWLLNLIMLQAGNILRVYLDERLLIGLRQRLFAHCDALSLAFSQQTHSGHTMALVTSDAPSVAGLFSSTIVGGLGCVVAVAVGIVLMLSLNWQLAILAALVPPLVAVLALFLTRPLRAASRRAQAKVSELTERFQEKLAGIREVVAFGQERAEARRFALTLEELLGLRLRVTQLDTVIQTGHSIFSLTATLVILGYGGYLVTQDQVTLGALIALYTLFGYLAQPARQVVGLISGAQKALASADRLYAFLDQEPRVQERASARAPRAVTGEVVFRNVHFAYQADRPVLHDVSFAARPGETIALVGPSGAGKSTVASLLARFYDPTSGQVLLDGVDLRDLTLSGLRAQLGIVFQSTFLFAGTIRDNLAYGRPEATEQQLIAAAEAANAWEFIATLPQGLETCVGERGVQLSEGQKQRLAIARALLREPAILILDEPTAALDLRSEQLLQTALASATRNRTTFVIAHRLTTVQRADRILVLEEGRIVQQGTHAELLAVPGLYRELFELQYAVPSPGAAGARGLAAAGV